MFSFWAFGMFDMSVILAVSHSVIFQFWHLGYFLHLFFFEWKQNRSWSGRRLTMLQVLFSIASVFQVLPSSRYIGTLLGAVHFTIVVEFIVGTLLGAIHFTIATGYTAGFRRIFLHGAVGFWLTVTPQKRNTTESKITLATGWPRTRRPSSSRYSFVSHSCRLQKRKRIARRRRTSSTSSAVDLVLVEAKRQQDDTTIGR